MASPTFGEIRGPLVVWLFFTLYLALLVTVLAPIFVITSLSVISLLIQAAEVYGVFCAFLVAFLAFKEKRRNLRNIFSSLGLKRDGTIKSVLWSFILFPLVIVIGLMSMTFVYSLSPISASVSTASEVPGWYPWYLIIQSFFPVAVVEEMVGRGYMLDRLMPQHPSSLVKALPAILLSSLLFTLYHVPTYLRGYAFSFPLTASLLALNVFPISVLLSIAYVRAGTRNIIGPVLVHFILDATPAIFTLASTLA